MKRYIAYETIVNPLVMGTFLNLYLLDNGVDMSYILMIQTILSIATVVLEIPTGMIGDMVGAKICLVGTSLLEVICFMCLIMRSDMSLIVYSVLYGLAIALSTSADSSYRTKLISLESIGAYNKISSLCSWMYNIRYIVIILAYGVLYEQNTIYPIYVQTVIAIVKLMIAIILKEVDNKEVDIKNEESKYSLVELWEDIKGNGKLKCILVVATIPAVTSRLVSLYTPSICNKMGIDAVGQSYITTAQVVIGLMVPIVYTKYYEEIKNKTMTILLVVTCIGLGCTLIDNRWVIIGMLLTSIQGSLYSIFVPRAICYHSMEKYRNTILSIMSLVKTFVYSLFTWSLSVLNVGDQVSLGIVMVIIVPVAIFSMVYVGKEFKRVELESGENSQLS